MNSSIERIRGAFCDDALYKLTFTFTFTFTVRVYYCENSVFQVDCGAECDKRRLYIYLTLPITALFIATVCLSVCPSCSGIVSKWLNVSSQFLQHRIKHLR